MFETRKSIEDLDRILHTDSLQPKLSLDLHIGYLSRLHGSERKFSENYAGVVAGIS